MPVALPITPITDFSLPTFVSQLFGFVYACYVSKVFLEEEDSCKCLCSQSQRGEPQRCKMASANAGWGAAPGRRWGSDAWVTGS